MQDFVEAVLEWPKLCQDVMVSDNQFGQVRKNHALRRFQFLEFFGPKVFNKIQASTIQNKFTPYVWFLACEAKERINWRWRVVVIAQIVKWCLQVQRCVGGSASRYACRDHLDALHVIGQAIPDVAVMDYDFLKTLTHMGEFDSRFDGLDHGHPLEGVRLN